MAFDPLPPVAEYGRDTSVVRTTGAGGGGGGGGGGDASAANQVIQTNRLDAIRDRLPANLGESVATSAISVVVASSGTFASAIGKADDAAAAGDAANSGLLSLVKRTNSRLTSLINTIANLLPSDLTVAGNLKAAIVEALPTGNNFLGIVGGRTVTTQASFTRPADTIAYTVGDCVSNSTTAPVIVTFGASTRVANGSGIIVGARLTKSATTTTNASFRLWLYTQNPTSDNDNSPILNNFSTRVNRLGYVDFSNPVLTSDCTTFIGSFPNNQYAFRLPSGFDLFGKLEARSAYVPASSEQFHLELSIFQD